MRMSIASELALITLMSCALCPDRIMKKDYITKTYGVSGGHLAQVVHRLGVEGFLRTVRGRSGGFTLARSADGIYVGDVIRVFQDFSPRDKFLKERENLSLSNLMQRVDNLWESGVSSFYGVMDQVTVADLVASKGK